MSTDLRALGCCCSKYRAKTSSPVVHTCSAEGPGVPGGSWLPEQSQSQG